MMADGLSRLVVDAGLPTHPGIHVDNTGGLWTCDEQGGRRVRDSHGNWPVDPPRMTRHVMRLFAPFHPAREEDLTHCLMV